MGNCWERCIGRVYKKNYLRTRYNPVHRDISIEFANLMDEESQDDNNIPAYGSIVSDQERSIVKRGNLNDLVEEQKRIDARIDSELVRQEEELRAEEEAYYEAKREAARAAKLQRVKDQQARLRAEGRAASSQWVEGDSDWDVAGGEDDFEMFLENVKQRSLAARTRALAEQVPVDAQSDVSSKEARGTNTDASSLELEWEHEAGMQPFLREKRPDQRGKGDGRPASDVTLEDELQLSGLAMRPGLLEGEGQGNNGMEWDDKSPDTDSRSLLIKSRPNCQVGQER